MILQPQIVGQNDYGYELPFTLEDGNGNAWILRMRPSR